METVINTSECSWSQISISIFAAKVSGKRGFEVKKTVEKEHVYASGADPVDIQSGNKKYEGNIKVLKFQVDKWNDAAQAAGYEDITDVPHDLISMVVQFKKAANIPIRTITVVGVAFTELGIAMEQNAKFTEVTLPFLAMKVVNTKSA